MSPYDAQIDKCAYDKQVIDEALSLLGAVDDTCVDLRREVILFQDEISDSLHVPVEAPMVSLVGDGVDGVVQTRGLLRSARGALERSMESLINQRSAYYDNLTKEDEWS